MFNNTAKSVLKVGENVMLGEFEYRKENYEKAFHYLRMANKAYDSLAYDEPWNFMIPTRHISSALLLEHGQLTNNLELVKEAEEGYRYDLGLSPAQRAAVHPKNVWALKGLIDCLQFRNE